MTRRLLALSVIALVATAACERDPAPPIAPAAPPASASPPSPSLDAGAAALEVVPGEGSCKVDEDCELSTYQEGCCVQGCFPYAIASRELAARRAKESCAKHTAPCPPPAPCPKRTHAYGSAACQRGHCVALRRPLPRRDASDDF